MRKLLARSVMTLAAASTSLAQAVTFYASPNGSPTGDGSAGRPWDLRTALTQPAAVVPPGSEIQLQAGTYVGLFRSTLAGTDAAPIVIRAMPGARATIDGNETATLGAALALAPSGSRSACQINHSRTFDPGQAISVDTEQLYIVSGGTNGLYECLRGWGGTTPAAHVAGTKAYIQAASSFVVAGPFVWVVGLEVTNSNPERRFGTIGKATTVFEKPGGVWLQAEGTKLINSLVHDNGHPGIGYFASAKGCTSGVDATTGRTRCTELYGNTVWGNGFYDDSRNGQWIGSGVYTQNDTGTKYIRDNVFFRNFTTGVNIYTQDGLVRNFHVEGNTSFEHGMEDIWATGGSVEPMSGLKILSNATYRRPNQTGNSTRFGYTALQGDIVYQRNYVVKGAKDDDGIAVFLNNFKTGMVTDNVFVTNGMPYRGGLAGIRTPSGVPFSAYTWNRNQYFDYTGTQTYGDQAYVFSANQLANRFGGGYLVFDDPGTTTGKGWRQWTGFDANSTYRRGLPTENKIFVRKNAYEAGRALVTIYNWQNLPAVSVDLSSVGLAAGQSFEVRDAQNMFAEPLVRASYSGAPVSIPMQNLRAAPLAGCAQITHLVCDGTSTAPAFGAFVVVPAAAASATAPAISAQGIVSSADYQRRLAPGSIVSIFGTYLASRSINTSGIPLPTSAGGTSVMLTDASGRNVAAPLFFVSPTQINLQWPFELSVGPVQVTVNTSTGTARTSVSSMPIAPGVYTQNGKGTGPASFVNVRDNSSITSTNGAHAGDYVSAYLTGLGVSNPPTATGALPTSGQLAWVAPTRVMLARPDGRAIAATTTFAGKAPTMVGVDQVNFQIPPDFWSGAEALQSANWSVGVQICSGDNFSVCSAAVSTYVLK